MNEKHEAGTAVAVAADTLRIWYVYDKRQGEVESYHPSYAWAWQRLKRDSEFRPVGMVARIGETRATFDGTCHRVIATAWDAELAQFA